MQAFTYKASASTLVNAMEETARGGVVAVICVGESTVNDGAAVPPNVTPIAPARLVPLIVTT